MSNIVVSRNFDIRVEFGRPFRLRARLIVYAQMTPTHSLHVTLRLMSSRRRSRSPYQSNRKSESPDRRQRVRKSDKKRDEYSDDERERKDLPSDAKPLTESDYFLKNVEFQSWLKEEKNRVRAAGILRTFRRLARSSVHVSNHSTLTRCLGRRQEGIILASISISLTLLIV